MAYEIAGTSPSSVFVGRDILAHKYSSCDNSANHLLVLASYRPLSTRQGVNPAINHLCLLPKSQLLLRCLATGWGEESGPVGLANALGDEAEEAGRLRGWGTWEGRGGRGEGGRGERKSLVNSAGWGSDGQT